MYRYAEYVSLFPLYLLFNHIRRALMFRGVVDMKGIQKDNESDE